MGTRDRRCLTAALARCDQEIRAIDGADNDATRAYLVMLGREDWLRERQLIEQEIKQYGDRSPA